MDDNSFYDSDENEDGEVSVELEEHELKGRGGRPLRKAAVDAVKKRKAYLKKDKKYGAYLNNSIANKTSKDKSHWKTVKSAAFAGKRAMARKAATQNEDEEYEEEFSDDLYNPTRKYYTPKKQAGYKYKCRRKTKCHQK